MAFLAPIAAIASIASVGVSTAQAFGAFDKSPPKPPDRTGQVEQARRRAVGSRSGKGRSQTLLTQRAGAPSTQTRTLLG